MNHAPLSEQPKSPPRPRELLVRVSWWRLAGMAAALCALLGALWLLNRWIDLEAVRDWMKGLDGSLVVLLLTVLPLVGFPASVLYVVAGAKFGSLGGLGVVAGSIVIDLLAAYWISSGFLRQPLENAVARLGYRLPQIPDGEYWPVTVLIALLPTAPFTIKNYLLPLAGVPPRIFFWGCLPVHVFNAALAILVGDLFTQVTPLKMGFVMFYGLANAGLCVYVVHRLWRRRRRSVEAVNRLRESV